MNKQSLPCIKSANLREAFGIQRREIISLVGGGGKTTLMFALACELSSSGDFVVTTTTTKILEPSASESQALFLHEDEDAITSWVIASSHKYRQVTVAQGKTASGKLVGVSPGMVDRLSGLAQVSNVIVEADGAARRPLKAPNATEPVIPAGTSLVIPVIGIDALGCRLTEEVVFRTEIASRLLGLPVGEVLSAKSIALLVTHPFGLTKGSPARARIVPFANKVDTAARLAGATEVAGIVLAVGGPRIIRVVLGQAAHPETGFTVISRQRVDAEAM